jgi:translation initiation factor IF-3
MNKFKKRKHKINREINYPTVRIVGNNIESRVVKINEAINIAESMDLDLILISENANPPVVRIEEYNKFLYNQEKAERERKKNSVKIEVKEIQLSMNIADNDLNTKSKKAIEFLEDGNKVKCVLSMKGRQNTMAEKGELVMLRFAQMSSHIGTPENMPKLEGSRWIMILKPKK